jgi:phage repressor protein C with HTH and peptisase S24 domain
MNKRYPEGSALIFTSIYETRETPQVGKRYIVETERPDGLREATVKTLWQDETGEHWLLPESTDPRYQQPIKLSDGDGNIVRIVGRVVFSVQRED